MVVGEVKLEDLVNAHCKYKGNVKKAAKALKISEIDLREEWSELKLETSRVIQGKKNRMKIIAAYESFEGNARAAGRALNVSHTLVGNYWSEAGLKSKGKKGSYPLPEEEVERLAKLYIPFKGNAAEAARRIKIPISRVNNAWKKKKLKAIGNRAPKEKVEKILRFHKVYNGSVRKICEETGYIKEVVYYHLKKNNIKFSHKRYISKEEMARIIRSHKTCNKNATEAERKIGISKHKISRIWKEKGYSLLGQGKKLTPKQISEIKEEYKRCGGNAIKAAEKFPYAYTTILKYRNWKLK